MAEDSTASKGMEIKDAKNNNTHINRERFGIGSNGICFISFQGR
jgi:hypothetical protein